MNRNVSYIGTRDGTGDDFKVAPVPFGISQADRGNHLYMVGKTGTGKSTLLKNLIIQDIQAGRGVCVLDPHGDQAEELLNYIPKSRAHKDVIYLNPADSEWPVGINFLPHVPPDQRDRVTNYVLSVFTHIWGLSHEQTPRLMKILRRAISSVMEYDGTTLLSVYRLLIDEKYREYIIDGIEDPLLQRAWDQDFPRDARRRDEIIESTLTRIEALVSSPVIRNTIGQVKKTIDFDQVMREEKIVICNLSKGLLGEDASNLLGSIILIQIYLASLNRAQVPENDRSPFHLYVDEFQNFGTGVFGDILSESRKYSLSLTLAHQFMSQLPFDVREAIVGNVGSLVSFRVGSHDAEELSREFSQMGSPMASHAFSDLGVHEIRVLLQENGSVGSPFLGRTFPPSEDFVGARDLVIDRSRRNFSQPRARVEQGILHRLTR